MSEEESDKDSQIHDKPEKGKQNLCIMTSSMLSIHLCLALIVIDLGMRMTKLILQHLGQYLK